MCGKKNRSVGPSPPQGHTPEGSLFPETQTQVLAHAAQGEWEPFFQNYLRPCWLAVCQECRVWGLQEATAEDLFGELVVRLMRDGRFQREIRTAADEDQQPAKPQNIPARFLAYRGLPLRQARFRNYLRKVIGNLALEAIRGAARRPQLADDERLEQAGAQLEAALGRGLDRKWLLDCLASAAWQLNAESRSSRTRARRRRFHILYFSAVRNQSAGKLAQDLGLDRSTVAALLSEARRRFLGILAQITGISDAAELRDLLQDEASQLQAALAQVYADQAATSEAESLHGGSLDGVATPPPGGHTGDKAAGAT